MKKQYGISKQDLIYCQNKIDNQRKYLSDNVFHTESGQVKSFLDVSFSANLSERYYAQLTNKINTMHSLALTQNLKPVFLTITLDGFFRDFLKGNFEKFKSFSSLKQSKILRLIPNDYVFGFLVDKVVSCERFTIKDLYQVLNYQWFRFFSSYSFKLIKKSGQKVSYLKSVEPHKDGVPHFHSLLWIPEGFENRIKKDFERYFPAPRNHKKLSGSVDTFGFQTAIHNPVGYVMKYVTKSFINLKTDSELDYIQAWYIKNKIRRLTTSHSTIPQWVYRKCYAVENDWFHLTDLTKREPALCEWSAKDDYFIFIESCGRTIEYDRGLLTLKYIDSQTTLKEFGSIKPLSSLQQQHQPIKFIPKKPKKHIIDVYIDNKRFSYFDGSLTKFIGYPKSMSNFELYQYYNSIDILDVNRDHFNFVTNEMISRGFIQGDLISFEFEDIDFVWTS